MMADLRELLILVLALLIVFSLLRAVFVIHRRKKGQIRLSIDKSISQSMELEQPEEEGLDELPNGGARPVFAGDGDAVLAREAEHAAAAPAVDEHVPVLTDAVKIAPLAAASSPQEASPLAASRQPEPARKREQQREDASPRHKPQEPKEPLHKTSKRNWKAEIYAANGAPKSRPGEQIRGPRQDRDQHPELDLGAVSMTAGERIGQPSGRPGRSRNTGNGAARPQTPAGPRPAAASQAANHAANQNGNAPEPGRGQSHEKAREESREEPRKEAREEPRKEPRKEPREEPRKEPRKEPREEPRKEPREEPRKEPRKEPRSADAAVSPDQIIALHVVAEEGHAFAGSETWKFLLAARLRYDDMKIFSKYDGNRDRAEPVFRVANLVNPGTFDSDDIDGLHIPGISLFMLLPTPIDNMRAFEQMLTVARRFAETFDGRLLDSRRQELTLESIEAIRRRIREFEMSAFGPSTVSSLI